MRLAFINQFYVPDLSPTAHLCASLAEHRAARGDEVTVITGRAGYLGPIEGRPDDSLVRVHRVWSSHLGSRTKARRFIDWATFYLSALKEAALLPPQDVIIAMTTPPYIAWAGVLHRLLNPKARLVLWNMDCWPEMAERIRMIRPGGPLSRAMRALNRTLFRCLDHLVCVDQAMVRLLSTYAPRVRPLRFSVIPNWERASLFPPDAMIEPWKGPTAAALRGGFVILYLGNAGYGHEFQTLLEAAEQLRHDRVAFLLVGGGSQFEWLREQSRTRDLHNILFHDYVPKEQTPSVMRAADCALITLEEQMLGVMSPSKLHANLAMGLPVIYIGPKGGNVDEAIEHFGCGVSIRVGETEKLVQSIRQLVADPGHHRDLRARARRGFDEAYCDTRTLPKFDQVLQQVVLPSSPSPSGRSERNWRLPASGQG